MGFTYFLIKKGKSKQEKEMVSKEKEWKKYSDKGKADVG